MSPPPRSLTFAVSTSLLTASLALAGCDEPNKPVNPGPADEAPKPEPDRVNVGPETPPQPEPNVNTRPEPLPPPEPIHVNEGPEPQPEPVVKSVNPGPEAEEPKRVNTQPQP